MPETNLITVLSIIGSLASIIGIPLALISISRTKVIARNSADEARASKEASLRAKAEVENFRKELRLIYNVIEFEKALALMEDIKSFIRHSNLEPVPDKVSNLIVLLNTIRSPSMRIGTEAEQVIQGSVVAMRKIEDAINRSNLSQGKPKGIANFNRNISEQIDLLQPILINLKNRIGEPK